MPFDTIRYEIRVGLTENTKEHAIKEERALIFNSDENSLKNVEERALFPLQPVEPKSALNKKYKPIFPSYMQVEY